MAHLDQLLTNIEDQKLRQALEAEVRQLKERTSLGLVFERHFPESVLLAHDAGLQIGESVRFRTRPNETKTWIVQARDGETITVADSDGAQEEAALSDLLVVKNFDEPVYATIRSVGSVRRGGDRSPHLVLESENFHALELLCVTHRGEFDCIYIDPPYNTGARDWKYNNAFVDQTDTYRHSKWLSFMEKRLKLAKELLRRDGVLIVTVDEHEVHHLAVLLEQLYPEYQRSTITIINAPQGNDKANFSRVEEYAIFCVPPWPVDLIEGSPIDFVPEAGEIDVDPDEEIDEPDASEDHYESSEEEGAAGFLSENARRRGNESFRKDRPGMFFPIYIDEEEERVVRAGPPIPLDQEPSFEKVEGLRPIWPIDSNNDHRRWRWGYDRMVKLIEAGEIQLGTHNKKRDTWAINRVQPRKTDQPFKKLKTVWRHTSHNAGTHGSGLLAQLLGQGQAFSFPKSLYATRDCLAAVCRSRPDALILDFFAGSGTTLHSTLLLNAADNGSRRCYLVTNNELPESRAKELNKEGLYAGDDEYERQGIFWAATRPRVEAAITGKRPDGQPVRGNYLGGRKMADGFEENVEFVRLEHTNPQLIELGLGLETLSAFLWLWAGGVGPLPAEFSADQPFAVYPESNYAVLLDDGAFLQLLEEIADKETIELVFIVTDFDDAFAAMTSELSSRKTVMLPRDYLTRFAEETGNRR